MLEFSSLVVPEELILVHPGKNVDLSHGLTMTTIAFAVMLGEVFNIH